MIRPMLRARSRSSRPWVGTRRFLALLGLCFLLPPAAAQPPDMERGRLLYENHCVVCHTSKVHRRLDPLPLDRKDLQLIVAAWAKGQQLGWSDGDVSDVVEYLDRTYYRMPRR